jgi:hypothetical protein
MEPIDYGSTILNCYFFKEKTYNISLLKMCSIQ